MGDQLVKDGDLDKAEARYLEAQAKAIEMHSAEDKAAADNALAKLADLRAKTKKTGRIRSKRPHPIRSMIILQWVKPR